MPGKTAPPAAVPRSTLRLPSKTEIEISRVFNAPRTLVWRVFTDEKLLPKWMGPAQYTMTTSKMDLRKGGKYHWVWDLGGGNELVFRGEFLDVRKPELVVTKEFMEPNPLPTHNTMTFTEKDGRTTVAILIKAPNAEVRDAMLASGMQDGMDAGYARADALLKDLG